MNTGGQLRQGGDLRDGSTVRLDLSTCINPYGPPETVLDGLRRLPAEAVRAHPFGAADDVVSAYAAYTGRPATEFVAGQGASDLIWALAQHFSGKSAGLPLPSYTEFFQAFPRARLFTGGPSTHELDVIDDAMRSCDVVFVSNPHNPTGQVIGRDDLAGVAAGRPDSILVVDESYIDFLPDHAAVTLIGCDIDNVIVLRSPSKFWGLAGVRSGVAWSPDPRHTQWRHLRTNWPVSAFAAEALKTVLADQAWSAAMHETLARDGAWLADSLAVAGLDITPGRLHFRLLTGAPGDLTRFATSLREQEIAVRVFTDSYGPGKPAIRIAAPRQPDAPILAAALASLCAGQ